VNTIPNPFNPPVIPDAYFDSSRGCYWITNSRGGWISITESALRRHLRPFLRAKPNDDEPLSPLDAHLNKLQREHDVAYAGPLAGVSAGVHREGSRYLLITESPILIKPVPGDWPVLGRLLENLLVDEVTDQRPYFFGWLKVAREALFLALRRPGQALCLAGPPDCGKSMLQNLITPLLGGRSAKPYGWMTGATDFNGDLFEAEHLIIEDEAASTDIRARRNFGARLKEVTVNSTQRCHAKNRQAVTLQPLWRTSITVNDEPENLMVLPPLDDSIADKLILLRANKRPMPMPTSTPAEIRVFMETLLSELPALCDFLEKWTIPRELVSHRFGITHYHHPEIVRAIDALAPETRLLQMIDEVVMAERELWSGTAEQLERLLVKADRGMAFEVQRLLHYTTACGVYLARLARKLPARVERDRHRDSRRWIIRRAPPAP